VVDHLSDLSIRNSSAKLDRVPMLFVHVVTRPHVLITIAQIECALWIAFQIHSRRNVVERSEGENFSTDLEDENVFAKRRALGRVRLPQAIFAKFFQVHAVAGGVEPGRSAPRLQNRV
jgi:hypothetical protein